MLLSVLSPGWAVDPPMWSIAPRLRQPTDAFFSGRERRVAERRTGPANRRVRPMDADACRRGGYRRHTNTSRAFGPPYGRRFDDAYPVASPVAATEPHVVYSNAQAYEVIPASLRAFQAHQWGRGYQGPRDTDTTHYHGGPCGHCGLWVSATAPDFEWRTVQGGPTRQWFHGKENDPTHCPGYTPPAPPVARGISEQAKQCSPAPWTAVKGRSNRPGDRAWGGIKDAHGWWVATIEGDAEAVKAHAAANAAMIVEIRNNLAALLAPSDAPTHGGAAK